MTLKALQPDDRLKAFDAAEGGNEVHLKGSGKVYGQGDLPVDLWVQGDVASDIMRDAVLRLTAGGPAAPQPACRRMADRKVSAYWAHFF